MPETSPRAPRPTAPSKPRWHSIPRAGADPEFTWRGARRRSAVVLRRFVEALPALAKYQVVTKLLQFALLFPGFWALTQMLLHSVGQVTLNNSNAAAFLLTWQGALWTVMVVALIFITLVMEIGGFIMISAVKLHGAGDPSYTSVLRAALRATPVFFGPGALIVFLLTVVVLPLVGSQLNLSFLAGLRIPNFITSVIESHPAYNGLYIAVMLLLYVGSVLGAFVFHFMLLGGLKAGQAYRQSATLVRRHFWRFMGFIAVHVLLVTLVVLGVIVGEILLTIASLELFGQNPQLEETAYLATGFISALLVAAAAYIATPFFVFALTDRYYTYLDRDVAAGEGGLVRDCAKRVPRIQAKTRPSPLDRLARLTPVAVIVALISVIGGAALLVNDAQNFIFDNDIPVIAHRGGPGTRHIENTLEAVEDSIRLGAQYVEVDVQRTADGHYILNHDDTFARLGGVKRAAQDMSLDEVRALKLSLSADGPFARVPTVEELFDLTKGRIGVFLELKGATADRTMVDDMVALINARDMAGEVIIMSLSYDLIQYVETTYPHMLSGFTYFLSFGDSTALLGDYVIVEEDALTRDALDDFHLAGKKVAVWTLNDPNSMRKFVHWSIDGAITDYVGVWNRIVDERDQMPPVERVWHYFVD